jgi:hypothetical protein
MPFDSKNAGPLVATVARLFAGERAAREVAVLAEAEANIEQVDYDNWNGGQNFYAIRLEVPVWLYSQFDDSQREGLEKTILAKIQPFLRGSPSEHVDNVLLTAQMSGEAGWQEKAKAWVAGKGVTNQGRVRSDNIAARTFDGLLFRSQPEIELYQALKAIGVSLAPLPVFIRGGESYRRIEPDFVVVKNGIVMAIEVDGDTGHHETPAEAHNRLTMLAREGIHIERVNATECNSPEKARSCAKKLIEIMAKMKLAK